MTLTVAKSLYLRTKLAENMVRELPSQRPLLTNIRYLRCGGFFDAQRLREGRTRCYREHHRRDRQARIRNRSWAQASWYDTRQVRAKCSHPKSLVLTT